MDIDSGRSSPVVVILHPQPRLAASVDIGPGNAITDDVTIHHIQRAAAALLVLHDSVDEEEIKEYLEQLETCAIHANEAIMDYLERNQVHIHMVSVMKHVPSFLLIQQKGLKILNHLAIKSTILRESMIACDCSSLTLNLLSMHTNDVCIQQYGIGLLACLLETEEFRKSLQYDNQERTIVSVIFHAIETLQDEHNVYVPALTSLVTCVQLETVTRSFVAQYHCDLLIERLRQASYGSNTRILLLKSICLIAKEAHLLPANLCTRSRIIKFLNGTTFENNDLEILHKHSARLIEKDTHQTLMEDCANTAISEDLASEALELLSILCKEETVQRVLVLHGFVQNNVKSILASFRLTDRVQSAGFRIIKTVVPLLMEESNNSDSISKLIVRLAFAAMFSHIDHPDVQIAACAATSALLEHDPGSHRWIGENTEEKQEPLHTLCLGAIMTFRKNAAVFSAASEAIYWIAADNERLCNLLMTKNVHIAIIEGLKRHRKLPAAVEKGCKALRGLCIFLPKHKLALVNEGTFGILMDLLPRYKRYLDTQIEMISLIASLADIEIVRHQCFVERFPVTVIELMTQHKENVIIQEIGLETFAVLTGAEEGLDIMMGNGTLNVTVDAMENFRDIALIQRKGLIILQVLANKQLIEDDSMRRKIADILFSIMKDFSDVKILCSEVCVTIQLLAECDAIMSKEFVHRGCHEYLFAMLEDKDQRSGLQELASECLYVLSQEQNLKSVMLLSACKNGMLPATECLIELGADVNIGEGSSTPLYIAVFNQKQDVVKLIIKQEVQDLLTSLRRSLEQETDDITGLLLQEIGYDKNAGLISWADLPLNTLKSSSILITLTNRPHADFDTEIGRHFLDKIKSSEFKRIQRRKLVKSKSDSSVRAAMRLRNKLAAKTERDTIDENAPTAPSTAMVVPNISPFSPSRVYRRSNSDDTMVPPSPKVARRPTLPTIISFSPDTLEFELSPTEELAWKQTTVTGANVPYSHNDPRQQITESVDESCITVSGDSTSSIYSPWMRKRSSSPRLSISSDGSTASPLLGPRKSSAPNIGVTETNSLIQRRKALADISDIAESTHLPVKNELVQIDISNTSISDINAFVCHHLTVFLAKLTYLDVSGNSITEVPTDLYRNLPALTHMNLSSNAINTFPDTVLKCEQLEHLDMSHNKIKEINLQVFSSSLKCLYLSHNDLTSLSSRIGIYCHKLNELTMNDNMIRELPESPVALKELRRLELSNNQITRLPEKFLHACHKLEEINLADNNIDQLPSEAESPILAKLTKVQLRNNRLEEKAPFYIPKFILELPSLRTIDLSGNLLKGLPPLLMWRSNMIKDFMVSNNTIASLNLDNAKVWSKLEKLHISKNYLSVLPKEVGQLSSLISLDISHNKGIITLPDELGKCSKIYELNLDGLDLDLDRTLLKRRVKDVISYLHNRLKKAQRYYRMKLMVVGYENRGKTTLLKTLMRRHSKEEKTRRLLEYSCYEKKDEDGVWFLGRRVNYTLSTWDFAGQEEFYSTHECYLSQRAVYLVVFDLRKGAADVENLKTWLASIRSHAQYCPVIVVGTHMDKLSKDETKKREEIDKISEKLREFETQPGLPTIHGDMVFLVDATSENESIDRLRNAIKKTVASFKIRGIRVMGEKVPASYVKLSDLLTDKAKSMERTYPVLRHRDLQQLVHEARLNLDDDDELKQAVRYLHAAGVLLHYDDMSMQLQDLYFIDPGWLCQMMAQIVTVRQINPFVRKDGILNKKDIYILFKEKSQFPDHLIPQYIKLLEKFEIALPHSETELLIPCKLPPNKPYIRLPDSGKNNTIKRIYSLPHIPIGLRSRLIARLITLTRTLRFRSELQIDENPRQIYWKTGLYMYWSEIAYFLLDSDTMAYESAVKDVLCFTVPKSCQGVRLLGQIVDCIDNLIEEWYPELKELDLSMEHELLEILAPCTQCPPHTECHMFKMLELLKTASSADRIYCPFHKTEVLLKDIVPDIVLDDVEDGLKLDASMLDFKDSSDKLLGHGGFSVVYRGKYRDKDVAVKLFKEIFDVHPLRMLRQEAAILRYLNHPSVVSLVAVGIHPPILLLELAPCGTLGTLIKGTRGNNKGIKRDLQHKIALQVTEGLAYLHDIMIVHRDLEPGNVLIYSTAVTERVIAKISDYGIARFTYMQSLKAQEGTRAYMAPEVIRKENYQSQADIFSLGLTFYVMLSGRHPFDNLDSKGEMDRAISEGLPIPPLSKLALPWPDMQSLTLRCLRYSPDERPTARMVYERLRTAEIYCLQQIVNVSKATTVECLAVERDSKHSHTKLWIASGDSEHSQLSYITMGDNRNKTKGFWFNDGRILCMEVIGDHYLAVGTQRGRVWIFDTTRKTYCHSSSQLQDSVLCMKHSKGEREGGWLLVGLANGKVAVFPTNELITEEGVDPICLYPGQEYEPVMCMVKFSRRVFLSCGSRIVVLNTTKGIEIEKMLETVPQRAPHIPPIYTLAVLKRQILFSKKGASLVEIWDSTKDAIQTSLDVGIKMNLSESEARVTALTADGKSIWVGTYSGHVGIIDMMSQALLAVTHRYEHAVRSLLHVNDLGSSKQSVVLSGGLGFKDTQRQETDSNTMCGCLLVWDADFPKYAKSLTEYELKRQTLHQCNGQRRVSQHSVIN